MKPIEPPSVWIGTASPEWISVGGPSFDAISDGY